MALVAFGELKFTFKVSPQSSSRAAPRAMAPARKFSRTPPPNKPPSLPVKPQSSILTAPSPEVLAKLPARLDYDALKSSFAAATKACREVARELPGVVEGCAAHGDAAS